MLCLMLNLCKSVANSGLFIARRFLPFRRSLLPAWRCADFTREACRCVGFFSVVSFRTARWSLITAGDLYIICGAAFGVVGFAPRSRPQRSLPVLVAMRQVRLLWLPTHFRSAADGLFLRCSIGSRLFSHDKKGLRSRG